MKRMATITCFGCDRDFSLPYHERKRRKYCSKECLKRYRESKKSVTITCAGCKEDFLSCANSPCQAKTRKYCSKECAYKHKKKRQAIIPIQSKQCKQCNVVFSFKYGERLFCSTECVNDFKRSSHPGCNQYGSFKTWTVEEDNKIKTLYETCDSIEELASIIDRTIQAIESRASRLGLHRSKEAISKALSRGCKGKNCGKKRPDLRKNAYVGWGKDNPFFGKKHSEETRRIISQKAKATGTLVRLNKDPEFQKKRIMALIKSPNKAETFLDQIIQEACPNQYKYTGDGTFLIDNLNPDWTNVAGQKKVIELFGEEYHDPEKAPRKINYRQTEAGRKEIFSSNGGYSTLIIWGKELANSPRDELIKKIRYFTEVGI